jgi:hypothetical protein
VVERRLRSRAARAPCMFGRRRQGWRRAWPAATTLRDVGDVGSTTRREDRMKDLKAELPKRRTDEDTTFCSKFRLLCSTSVICSLCPCRFVPTALLLAVRVGPIIPGGQGDRPAHPPSGPSMAAPAAKKSRRRSRSHSSQYHDITFYCPRSPTSG